MKDPEPQFTNCTEQLKKLKLAYLHVVEIRVVQPKLGVRPIGSVQFILEVWGTTRPVLLATG
jgi:NADPH2 dehydrogenase